MNGAPLPKSFFQGGTVETARDLLGAVLQSEIDGVRTSGIITETEAYPDGDPASHAFAGRTRRNAAMFGAPGTVYAYLSYGLHVCVNVVTGPIDQGEAVLIRELEPLEGLEAMRMRRGSGRNLCNGPGRLCQALAIGLELNGHSLDAPPLRLLQQKRSGGAVVALPRIGISKAKEQAWRFRLA